MALDRPGPGGRRAVVLPCAAAGGLDRCASPRWRDRARGEGAGRRRVGDLRERLRRRARARRALGRHAGAHRRDERQGGLGRQGGRRRRAALLRRVRRALRRAEADLVLAEAGRARARRSATSPRARLERMALRGRRRRRRTGSSRARRGSRSSSSERVEQLARRGLESGQASTRPGRARASPARAPAPAPGRGRARPRGPRRRSSSPSPRGLPWPRPRAHHRRAGRAGPGPGDARQDRGARARSTASSCSRTPRSARSSSPTSRAAQTPRLRRDDGRLRVARGAGRGARDEPRGGRDRRARAQIFLDAFPDAPYPAASRASGRRRTARRRRSRCASAFEEPDEAAARDGRARRVRSGRGRREAAERAGAEPGILIPLGAAWPASDGERGVFVARARLRAFHTRRARAEERASAWRCAGLAERRARSCSSRRRAWRSATACDQGVKRMAQADEDDGRGRAPIISVQRRDQAYTRGGETLERARRPQPRHGRGRLLRPDGAVGLGQDHAAQPDRRARPARRGRARRRRRGPPSSSGPALSRWRARTSASSSRAST